MAAEGAQEFPRPDGSLEHPVAEQQTVTFRPQAIHQRAGHRGEVNIQALEPLVPVPLIVDDPARHIRLPQRRPADPGLIPQPVKWFTLIHLLDVKGHPDGIVVGAEGKQTMGGQWDSPLRAGTPLPQQTCAGPPEN